MSETTTARARAEAWFQGLNGKFRELTAKVPAREAADFVNNARDEAERRVDGVVERVLSTFQTVTSSEVAELDAKLKTIAKRIEQVEKKYARNNVVANAR